ncbi:hypothetical protein GH5_05126 [Leishmania sp. Ghana 2012 LV757]|uniref:hypothetical protein n=1 Tax=Leishmania sp. Ghana 2012 LV757 TaxID=2803181 RepID=UPI001B4F7903|nr:hypothetical protein GH5_05126 [Leishmania sp. Ghana 2012 LV757]
MSDSDWEVLSSDGEEKGAPPLRPALTTSIETARRAAAGAEGGVEKSTARHALDSGSRQVMLTPLCLTLNQTGTRIGVGHTRGFLVFRVVAAPAAADAHKGGEAGAATTMSAASPWMTQKEIRSATPARGAAANAAGELRLLPAQSQLLLDPQYNVDLLTFSHIRERMRQQQQERAAKAACSSLPQPTTATPPSRVSPAVVPEGAAGCSHARQCAAASDASASSLSDEVLSGDHSGSSGDDAGLPADLENDLGSFLTTAGRTFAQIRRDRQSLSSRKSNVVTGIKSRDRQRGEAAAKDSAPSAAAAAGHGTEEAHATGARGVRAETPAMMSQTCPSQCTRLTLEPSTELEWGKDEDIGVDPYSSDADLVAVERIDVGASSSAASSSSAAASRKTHDGAGESEDDYVGFEGGGVAVMAFLYEQTWMALVGGGPTPMGTPKCVQFIRDGELQHRLLMPDPVVRLFLDARLLFVVTTAQLRLYTNPIEREWTCLRQWLPLSAAVASRYAFVAPPVDGDSSANAPVRMWDKLPSPDPPPSSANSPPAVDGAEGLHTTPFSSLATRPGGQSGGQGTWAAAVSLPIIPVVVDYARSLLLLPVGEEGKGFALYRYVSGPEVRYTEMVGNTDMSSSASTAVTGCASVAAAPLSTGRTTSFLQHIATQSTAHRNPLHNLALYVGWPSSIARLLSPDKAVGAADQAGGSMSSGHPDESISGGPVTLVAASSEYATRLTLWMLQGPQPVMASPCKDRPSSPSAAAAAGAAAFVLLREFRVGVRLAAPQVVMASLPGVSRYIARGHAALAGTSGRSATSGGGTSTETASLTGAGLLKNVPVAGDTARPQGTATPASASGLFLATSSPSSSASHTSTMSFWATESAAAVASSTAKPAAVQHLQFVGNGAYLLCVHGADIISIFSTSARETEQEAKNVCRDRVAAEQNRYSRLSIMKEYLPRALSSRLEAYTRQAWSSCSGRLPSADPTFMPRWICAQRRDMSGAKTASTATAPAAAPIPMSASHGTRTLEATTDIGCLSSRGKRCFFQRLTSLVGSRPPTAMPETRTAACVQATALPGNDEDEPSADIPPSVTTPAGRSRFPRARASQRSASPGAPFVFLSSSLGDQSQLAASGGWGTPLADLPQCIQVWSSAPHAGNDTPHLYTNPAYATSSPKRPPIVLNCATCEGAFTNIVLFTEEGELLTSQVMPYAAS